MKIGDVVLLRQNKENKLSTRFEVQEYEIIGKKGNAVTLRNEKGEKKVRNSREVKLFHKEEGKVGNREIRRKKYQNIRDIYPHTLDVLDEIEIEDPVDIEVVEPEEAEGTVEMEIVEPEEEEEPVEIEIVEPVEVEQQQGRGHRNKRRPAYLRDYITS